MCWPIKLFSITAFVPELPAEMYTLPPEEVAVSVASISIAKMFVV